MGKVKKGATSQNNQQQKISSFFIKGQSNQGKLENSKLFTTLGKNINEKSHNGSSTKGNPATNSFSGSSASVVENQSEKKEPFINPQNNDKRCSPLREHNVVPETQIAHPDMIASPISVGDQSLEVIIPDTPDDESGFVGPRKKVFNRSFLSMGVGFNQRPGQIAKSVRDQEKLKRKELTKARKSLISCSVKFIAQEKPSTCKKWDEPGDDSQDITSVTENVGLNAEEEKKLDNLCKSACVESENIRSNPNTTPVKMYHTDENISVKRMSKDENMPNAKRSNIFPDDDFGNISPKSHDENEAYEFSPFKCEINEIELINKETPNSTQKESKCTSDKDSKKNNLFDKNEKAVVKKKGMGSYDGKFDMNSIKKTLKSSKLSISTHKNKSNVPSSKVGTSAEGDDLLNELLSKLPVNSDDTVEEKTALLTGIKDKNISGKIVPKVKLKAPVPKLKQKDLFSTTEEEEEMFQKLDTEVHPKIGDGLITGNGVEEKRFCAPVNISQPIKLKKTKCSVLLPCKNSVPVSSIKEDENLSVENANSESGVKMSAAAKVQTTLPTPSQMISEFNSQEDCFLEKMDIEIDSSTQPPNTLEDLSKSEQAASANLSKVSRNQVPPVSYFNRYTVLGVLHEGDQVQLTLQAEERDATRLCFLEGFWSDTHIFEGDIVHVLTSFDDTGTAHVTDKSGLIIVNPDLLLSGTTIVSSVFCMRKSILNEKFKGSNTKNVQMLYGSIIHCVFQEVLTQKVQTAEDIIKIAQDVMQRPKFVHEMYSNSTTDAQVLEEIKSYIPQLQKWIELYTVQGQSHLGAKRRNSSEDSVVVSSIQDIEENIWSPRYGMKGKIDLTVKIQRKNKLEPRPVPLELKTGRPTYSLEHKGQVTLYSMMSGDRRDDPEQGLLLYLKEPSMKVIPVDHVNKRGLVQLRNEMAYYLSRTVHQAVDENGHMSFTLGRLPDPISNERACSKCPQLLNCSAYLNIENRQLAPSHALSTLGANTLAHLSKSHLEYFTHWCLMLDLEAEVNLKSTTREIWTKTGPEREKQGNCLSGLKYMNQNNDRCIDSSRDDCVVEFVENKDYRSNGSSLLESSLAVGDYIIISVEEPSIIALCTGTVLDITESQVHLCTEKESLGKLEIFKHCPLRLDKTQAHGTTSILYSNLSRLMEDSVQSSKLRQLLIDRKLPEFVPKLSKSQIEQVRNLFKPLNKPQKTAILKVLMSKDYVLIRGFPGTGKTSTIVALVKVLRLLRKSVLLTSYTHSAVDNILLKLKKDKIPFLRLGNTNKISPDLLDHSADKLTRTMTTVAELREFYSSQTIVATSCLGVGHSIFTQRRFDVCIVDEASQILQPASLGPLFFADQFVLVGDPKQLPPVVQSKDARTIGMDESMFLRIQECGATFDLNLQYRMNRRIMSLSNKLVYDGALKCGSDAVAMGTLIFPNIMAFKNQYKDSKWILDSLDDSKEVVFVETSKCSAHESKDKAGLIVNRGEADIVSSLAQAMLVAGIDPKDIGVIAPYRNQVALIKSQMSRLVSPKIEVNTVDQYQGRDKDTIIISFTRSFKAEEGDDVKTGHLLKDVRRLNVAITRAKKKLLLVGNQETLQKYGPLSSVIQELQPNELIICDYCKPR